MVLPKPRADLYAAGHPRPGDVLLVVEVADTSLVYDQTVKISTYAPSAILEVWVVE